MNDSNVTMSRDFFAISSDGEAQLEHYADIVCANVADVCKSLNSPLCWNAEPSDLNADLCVVRSCGRIRVAAVNRVSLDGLLNAVFEWAKDAIRCMKCDSGNDEVDLGVGVRVVTTVLDGVVTTELVDDDGDVPYALSIAKMED